MPLCPLWAAGQPLASEAPVALTITMSLWERTFRLLAALVSLGDGTRLPVWAVATVDAAVFAGLAVDAATWA